MVRTLYHNRWLLYEFVLRDVVLKYRGSVLGFLWTLLNPLLFIAVFTLVFSVFLRVALPNYVVFLIAGLIPWQWFATSIQAGTTSIVDGRMYVGKTALPPIILVFVPVFSNLVHFLMSLPIVLAVAVIFHVHIGWSILILPLLVGIQLLFTLGVALCFATFNVFYRDMQQLATLILMLVFYLTPIIYPIAFVPEHFRLYVLGSPMAALIQSYQDVLYYRTLPSWRILSYALSVSAAVFYAGYAVFDRYKDAFADYV